jgi:hypothetical protein
MAQQTGLLKIEGTLGGITFYKTKDGHLAKTKGGVSKERIASDPNFARTRENGSEFGSAASAGKLLRDACRVLMQNTADARVTSRVTQVMTAIKNLDTSSARGDRNVAEAISDMDAKALLKNFNFNVDSLMSAVLFKPITVNTTTGEITFDSLVPINDIAYPKGATHVALRGAWAKVDFANNTSSIVYTSTANLPIDATDSGVTLSASGTPSGTGTSIYLLAIEFFQQVNSVQYPLKSGSYNALTIIEVA